MKLRKNVAMVIINNDGLVLAGERSDIKGAWQLPQGGIDGSETPQEAMYRELFEETGYLESDVQLLKTAGPVSYAFPENTQTRLNCGGQEQIYFLLKLLNTDKLPCTGPEFSDFKWDTKENILNNIVEFKRNCYKSAFKELFGDNG